MLRTLAFIPVLIGSPTCPDSLADNLLLRYVASLRAQCNAAL